MGWTKQELVEQAYEEIGLASYVFELQPEQIQSGVRKMNAMMAQWSARGIRLGYSFPVTANGSDPALDSGVPDRAVEAVYLNLALRLASAVGKEPSIDLRREARKSYLTLLGRSALPQPIQYPSGMPAGAGNKPWRGPQRVFLDDPEETLDAGPDGPLTFK